MTNKERLHKLQQAEKLIREVEFSYPQGDTTRQTIYRTVVHTFSFIGSLSSVMEGLKTAIKVEDRAIFLAEQDIDTD